MTKVYIPVSVKDELPPELKYVPIFTKQCGELTGYYSLGEWVAIYGNGKRNVGTDDEVTHWLKEVDLPDYERIISEARKYPQITASGFIVGAKYILNLLTPNNNEQEKHC